MGLWEDKADDMTRNFTLQLEWQTRSRAGTEHTPLVVLLPWVWAEDRYTAKYAEMARRNEWEVVTAKWPMQAIWFPLWADRLALSLVEAMGLDIMTRGERPVVFWVFSGSAKVSCWAIQPAVLMVSLRYPQT